MGFDLRRAKLGKVTTPNGSSGDNAPQTVNNTAHSVGPLEQGWYTLECTSATYVLQVSEDEVAGVDTTDLTNFGLMVPANNEVEFSVDKDSKDGYIVWTRVSSDGTIRINSRSRTGS